MALFSRRRRGVIVNRYPPEAVPWTLDQNSSIVWLGDSISTLSTWNFQAATIARLQAECTALHGSAFAYHDGAIGSTYSYSFTTTKAVDTVPYAPTHLVVELGVNNVLTPDMATYEADMRLIISSRRIDFPALKVLLIVPWVTPYGAGYETNMRVCRDACLLIGSDTTDVHVLDWQTYFLGRTDLTADGLVHPSTAGKAAMNDWLVPHFLVV